MSNSVEKAQKTQKLDKLTNNKKRVKKSSSVDSEKPIIENGTNSDAESKTKKLKAKRDTSNDTVITDLLTRVPQLGYVELGGGEGLGNGVIINRKNIFIPRARKIQIYFTKTQTLIRTLSPSFSTDSSSILKIQLSPSDKTLFCLTSDGKIHYWSGNFDNYEGSLKVDKTVLDFQLTKKSLSDDAEDYSINLLVRDDSYDTEILSELKFKSDNLETKWNNYWENKQESGDFASYVVTYDKTKSDKEITVGTSNTTDHYNHKEDTINDAVFLQTIVKSTENWNLSGVVRIPPNCVVFNELRGYPNVIFTFVDNIITLVDLKNSQCTTYAHSRPITTIAIHPTLPQFAYGDNWGKILLNQFTIEDGKVNIGKPNCTLHWHSQGVTSLCYLSSGIHLLSGGKESVMVQWNLVEGKTRLLPRLPQAIQTIHPYGVRQAAIRCDDGSITVIHDIPDFKQLTVFKGIDIPSNEAPVTGYDPRTNELAMISQNDKILFLNSGNGEITRTLETSQINKIQQTNEKQQIIDPRITQVKFTDNGEWLITSEYWDPVGFPSQSGLKFWQFDSHTSKYVLATHILEPHLGQILNLQVFNHASAGLVAITLGEDNFTMKKLNGSVKLVTNIPASNKLLHFDVSSDGTLCALTSSSKIVLWDPLTNNTLTYLAPSLISPQMLKAQFISNTPYLVIQSVNHLSLVNLIHKTQSWKLDLSPQQILIDRTHTLIHCVVPNTKENVRLITFDPKNGEAVGFCQIPVDENTGKLPNLIQDNKKSLVLEDGRKCSKLYWIDGNRSLFGLAQSKNQLIKTATITKSSVEEFDNSEEVSEIKKTIGTSAKRTASGDIKLGSFVPDLTPFFEILKAPGHMLPGLKSIFSSLVNRVLPPKQTVIDEEIEIVANDTELTNGEHESTNNTEELSNGQEIINKPFIQTYKTIDTSLSSVTPSDSELNQFLSKITKN
ncbi:hypothetical protein CONCODRAFT_86672 [Conidiobolus coronatus NRRL 28638]|uniref:WD repeat-containing protein 75 second beta-propeller domain-containing protein n=1 Tax=Conidiobolus coronatus (strain ATCC 28846 / CBS 209.66 / NRRL 28638) TaxID=796925 RepID=A0A137NZ03_CONC2|nr:hypothetical protein CONCODRAFT_86672 [Conidiobolus coronatus NRRL 28638]|eukprot:KXN68026.1 hypothetical protein CONCODRAFT_86672 [Conidiobolus coronatus NRRL 28638]